MKLTRRFLLMVALALPVAGSILRPALADEPEIYAPGGVAISGYDPVAYFAEHKPVLGSADHALRWRGAMWYFVDGENMEAFEMNPSAYAPQYGGYCAYALSKGAIAPTVPEAFTIHDGALYLNNSTAVRTIWTQDIPGNILKANANWPTVLQK
jgi:YHS domain-containing protein